MAEALGRDGAHVIVLGRDPQRGAGMVAAIEARGGEAEFVAADLSDPARIAALAQEIGDVDILVNNAGFARWAPTADLAPGWRPTWTATPASPRRRAPRRRR